MDIRKALVCIGMLAGASALAQGPIRLPEASPAATAGQTVGVTDIAITYHRPAVNKRKIFGGLVPYGVLWRAGANENTTISFSTPVKIEGQPLSAGTYGFFLLPGPSQWTVIFSKFTGSWGTYNYDPAEDALRVTVTPQSLTDNQERLAYTFDDLTNNSAVVSLRWEKLRVPVKVEVDLPATVRASIREELRGGKHWNEAAWAAAARWELRNGDVDGALRDADHALSLAVTATTLRTKAAVLDKKGDKTQAAALRERSKQFSTEADTIYNTGFDLLGAKKFDDALAFANGYIKDHPNSGDLWRAYVIAGQAYAEKGDKEKSREAFDKAMAAAHDMAERTEAQDFINSLGAEGKS